MRSKPFFAVLNSCAEWTRSFASGKAPRTEAQLDRLDDGAFCRSGEGSSKRRGALPHPAHGHAEGVAEYLDLPVVEREPNRRRALRDVVSDHPAARGAHLRRGAEEVVEFIVALLVHLGELGQDRLKAVGRSGGVGRGGRVGLVERVREVVAEGFEGRAVGAAGDGRGEAWGGSQGTPLGVSEAHSAEV